MKINKDTSIDLQNLIGTRLLIQANSGGGKSWLLRRLLEQSHGKVQQIVIDLEGEFSSLREKFDYVLAGKGGDTPAEPRSAGLLARKLLELNVSAIIDLYELHHQDRKRFVRLFLESMINAPKELWHPVIVVIDEAHVFAPEKGQSEAMEAVIDLATRGRKRGYCAVLATQRLSKLHKDAAAECNNKLIGRTGLDIDMKRASEELGFTSKEQYLSLRSLQSGEFYAFGPAISTEIIKVKVGDVQTTHPKAGSKSFTHVSPPTAKIKKILGKLADLPQEARKEAETVAELKQEVRLLKSNASPSTINNNIIERVVKDAEQRKDKEYFAQRGEWLKHMNSMFKVLEQVSKMTSKELEKELPSPDYKFSSSNIPVTPFNLETKKIETRVYDQTSRNYDIVPDGIAPMRGGAMRMLKVLVSRYPMKLTKAQLATFSKLSPRSGTFGTYFSALKTNNYIVVEGDLLQASKVGLDFIGEAPNPPQTTAEIIKSWRGNFTGGAQRMFDALIESYPSSLSREQLGIQIGMAHTSGSFGTYLSLLRNNGLITSNGADIKASNNIFI